MGGGIIVQIKRNLLIPFVRMQTITDILIIKLSLQEAN